MSKSKAKLKAVRYHDFCSGHRVVGHESKCANLHGHNYRIHFHCEANNLDNVGRVIDFSVIKVTLCEWLEREWDHRMLIWCEDPMLSTLKALDDKVVTVSFNPTAENMALYLMNEICPQVMADTGITVTSIIIDETRKCSVICEA